VQGPWQSTNFAGAFFVLPNVNYAFIQHFPQFQSIFAYSGRELLKMHNFQFALEL
jgi:hypothetical protein